MATAAAVPNAVVSGKPMARGRTCFVEPFRVKPGSKVSLAKDFDPAFKRGPSSKKQGRELLARGIELLAEYQSRLYAQDAYGVLIVLQALDAAREGWDHSTRDERRESAGRVCAQLQGSVE